MPEVVPFVKPDGCSDVAEKLRALADRAEAGEFNHVLYVIFRPSGDFLSGAHGASMDALIRIGALEVVKHDAMGWLDRSERPDTGI